MPRAAARVRGMPFLASPAHARVTLGNGVEVETDAGRVALDPARETPHSVVTHAHLDHLGKRAPKGAPPGEPVMTAPTLDLMRLRRPASRGRHVPYRATERVGGLDVALHDAGHVLGSAMVEVAGVLYTGDFNPAGGLTCAKCEPRACDTLVTESTYGDPRFELPPRDLVLASIEAWALRKLLAGPVALGAYQLGRAQELVALLNRAGQVPIVSHDIAQVNAIYNAHGHDLAYAVAGSPRAQEIERGNAAWIVPRGWLKKDSEFARKMRTQGGASAYLSGWCHLYSYFNAYDIETQFPLTDHAGFRELLEFVEACAPRRVLTMHGAAKPLAREIRRTLGIPADALE